VKGINMPRNRNSRNRAAASDPPARKLATSKFYNILATTQTVSATGPVSHQANQQDVSGALQKAGSLLGYQAYLEQARTWKAKSKGVPSGFEREVQTQAANALTDTQALASATVRVTARLKHSGEIDRMLANWVATIKKSGPVHTSDLVSDIQGQPEVRQKLKDKGLTDDMWNTLVAQLKNLDGRFRVHNGRLGMELKVPNQRQTRRIVLAPSAHGMPKTLSDLLRRGTFEQQAKLFEKSGGTGMLLAASGPQRDLEIPDAVLTGAILGVQSMANHYRGVQDIGVSKYAGRAWFAAAILIALVVTLVGAGLATACNKRSLGAECIVGGILLFLGLAVLAVAAIIVLAAIGSVIPPPSQPVNPADCPSGRVCVGIDGSVGCCAD
jgi:hypothetical protein